MTTRDCQFCGNPLPAQRRRGRRRKWCNLSCKSKHVRQTHPNDAIRIDCRGCGLPLDPQAPRRGSPFRYHHECQEVVRKWCGLGQVRDRLRRYRELRELGAAPELALFGCTGRVRFAGTVEVITEETRKRGA